MHLLKVLKDSGVLIDKNLERIRAENQAREMKYSLIDKSLLIEELDTFVMNIIQEK
jgi:hypothetical protein